MFGSERRLLVYISNECAVICLFVDGRLHTVRSACSHAQLERDCSEICDGDSLSLLEATILFGADTQRYETVNIGLSQKGGVARALADFNSGHANYVSRAIKQGSGVLLVGLSLNGFAEECIQALGRCNVYATTYLVLPLELKKIADTLVAKQHLHSTEMLLVGAVGALSGAFFALFRGEAVELITRVPATTEDIDREITKYAQIATDSGMTFTSLCILSDDIYTEMNWNAHNGGSGRAIGCAELAAIFNINQSDNMLATLDPKIAMESMLSIVAAGDKAPEGALFHSKNKREFNILLALPKINIFNWSLLLTVSLFVLIPNLLAMYDEYRGLSSLHKIHGDIIDVHKAFGTDIERLNTEVSHFNQEAALYERVIFDLEKHPFTKFHVLATVNLSSNLGIKYFTWKKSHNDKHFFDSFHIGVDIQKAKLSYAEALVAFNNLLGEISDALPEYSFSIYNFRDADYESADTSLLVDVVAFNVSEGGYDIGS